MRIGYYVHHHGRGHATRAGVIGAALTAAGHHVTYLGSGTLPDGDRLVLPRDDSDAGYRDPDAGGALHWAPLAPSGYGRRSADIAAWVTREAPAVVVVDVSVEVTALVRLLGIPVVVVAQPGVRDDAAHHLAYRVATRVLAPWPGGLDIAPTLSRWGDKVDCVGGISRFEGHLPAVEPSPDTGAFLVGGEGWDDPTLPDAVRAATAHLQWITPDAERGVDEVLTRSAVVVAHAGQNAIADIAALGTRAVVVPQRRPFGEQADMAHALGSAGLARALPLGAGAPEVATAVLEVMSATEPSGAPQADTAPGWARWNIKGAARRAAAVIERAGETP